MQIVFILYAALFSISQLTSNTSAFFNHSSAVNTSISTGFWWDGSDLLFIGKGNQNLNDSCPPVDFSVDIKNNGYSMIGPTNYEIFYIENGNPKNGEKVSEGKLEAMQADDVTTISYQAEDEGFYVVKAYQRPDYEGESEEVIWSEKIKVKCPEKDKKNEKEKQSDEVDSLEGEDLENESSEEDLVEPADKETKEAPEEDSKEQPSSKETEEKPDKPSEQTDNEKETTVPEQEKKQTSSSEPSKETADKPKQAVTNKIEKEKPVDAEEQENSQVKKEGEQE